jgi:hypothetical protein
MELKLRTIHFLDSGALLVQLEGRAKETPTTKTAVDAARYRVYIPAMQRPDSVGDITALALEAAAQHTRTTRSGVWDKT